MLGVSVDDAEGVSVAHTALPALNDDDGVTDCEHVKLDSALDTPLDAAVDILLPIDLIEVGLGLGEQERVDTAVQVTVARSGLVASNHEDGADGAVLGEQAGRVTRGGQDDDTSGTEVEGGADSGHGAGLDGADGALGQSAHLLKVRDIRDGVLGLETSLVHLVDSLGGVSSLGSLSRQHDAVRAIGNSVTDIADLGTGRARVLDHGFQHLGGADDGLSGNVAHGNKLLLSGKHLSGGDLDTKITASYHDTVSLAENFREVVKTLAVLDLGDDLNVLAVLPKNLADVPDVLSTANEGGEDHVDVVLDAKLQISLILVGEGGKVNVCVGQVDTLLGGDEAVVASAALNVLVVLDAQDIESEDTIVDVDDTTGLDDFGDVLVVDVPIEALENGTN